MSYRKFLKLYKEDLRELKQQHKIVSTLLTEKFEALQMSFQEINQTSINDIIDMYKQPLITRILTKSFNWKCSTNFYSDSSFKKTVTSGKNQGYDNSIDDEEWKDSYYYLNPDEVEHQSLNLSGIQSRIDPLLDEREMYRHANLNSREMADSAFQYQGDYHEVHRPRCPSSIYEDIVIYEGLAADNVSGVVYNYNYF